MTSLRALRGKRGLYARLVFVAARANCATAGEPGRRAVLEADEEAVYGESDGTGLPPAIPAAADDGADGCRAH